VLSRHCYLLETCAFIWETNDFLFFSSLFFIYYIKSFKIQNAVLNWDHGHARLSFGERSWAID
jgi:hypothetical protein